MTRYTNIGCYGTFIASTLLITHISISPYIQLPIIPIHSLSFFNASAYCSTSLSYISLFLFLFHLFSHNTLLLFYINPYLPSDLLQPLSIFFFLLHINCIQIAHASLFLLVHIHTYNHYTTMPFFHSLSRKNILLLPSVLLLHQNFYLQNFHFFDFLSFVHTLSPFLCH